MSTPTDGLSVPRWLTRFRVDVPKVHAVIEAQQRMLNDWSETAPGSPERRQLWQQLHRSGDALADLAYGGVPITVAVSYWLRPYDFQRDARCWRWRRSRPCRVPVVLDGRPHANARTQPTPDDAA